ncbi:MAG: aminotransferase class III-fold pyridoxal phosphate-dependent enzyme [Firmicutes bacterium]|nr:aminotransferase class III-fold pyridoxal phosphate-dependent enzyme [Bacillota bacterium]
MHPYYQFVNPVLAKRLKQLNMDKVFRQGTGCELIDEAGESYLDFIASYGALPFGFNHPEIWAAIYEVQNSLAPSMVQPSFLDAAGKLAAELIKIAPKGIKYVTYANSGAEANEAAFKLARIFTKRMGILTTENSFHGKTLGALSATGKDSYQKGFGAPVPGFDRIPYGDLNRLEEALKSKPHGYAAFIVEPIQGEGGIIIPPDGYLREALKICHRYGTLLIADEVQTGLGRTGRMFACEAEGITPDIITVAKALGGGVIPIGACLCTEEVYTDDFALKHSSTFAGNTLACHVGLKVIELLTRDQGKLIKEVAAKGDYLLERLIGIQKQYASVIAAVRGRGLMLGLELGLDQNNPFGKLLGIMEEQEFLSPIVSSYLLNVKKIRVAPTLNGTDVIRMEPPLIIDEANCKKAMDAVEEMASCLASGNTALLLSHLVRSTTPKVSQPKLVVKKPVHPSGDPKEGRFAFIVHPLYLKNFVELDRTLEAFSEVELNNLISRWNDLVEPFVVAKTRITSQTGATAYGEFICVSRTSEELMNLPKEQVLAELSAAVNLAKERGAEIVGLGAYTSVVTKGGRDLRNLGVPLTTGNSYTVSAAVDATLESARRLETPIDRTIAAVVGATGSIGRNTAIFLAEKVNSLILIGNPLNQEHSRRRLMKLVAEIYQHLNNNQIIDGGTIYQFVKEHSRIPASDAPLEDYLSFAETVVDESPVIYTVEIEKHLPQADVVVTATSQVNSLITPDMLKYGAVVCDVSRPPDVSYEVKEARPDVLVIDGGVMSVPGCPDLGWDFGFEPGQAYACMSETMMLALEQHYQHFGLGTDINAATVAHTRKLAEKHGFKLAGFRSFDRPLSDESWEAVIKARRKRQEPSVVSL